MRSNLSTVKLNQDTKVINYTFQPVTTIVRGLQKYWALTSLRPALSGKFSRGRSIDVHYWFCSISLQSSSITCFVVMMPVALATTKRKFHKILDSISNSSSLSLVNSNDKLNASTTTLPATADSPAKKPRITRPLSASVPPSSRTLSISTSITRPPVVALQAQPPAMKEDREPPNFAPWDRGQFLKRLATFRHVDKWRSKEEKVNEVQWAKRGWSCVGKEKVCCVGGCERQIVIILESDREAKEDTDTGKPKEGGDDEEDDDWREQARAQLVDKYAEMITTAHERGCQWQRRGCDGTLIAMKVSD